MALRQIPITVTTDASGDCTATGASTGAGELHSFYLDIGDLANTVDITIKDAVDGRVLWAKSNLSASGHHFPRIMGEGATGTASTLTECAYGTSGRITVVAAQGGNVKTGKVYVYLS